MWAIPFKYSIFIGHLKGTICTALQFVLQFVLYNLYIKIKASSLALFYYFIAYKAGVLHVAFDLMIEFLHCNQANKNHIVLLSLQYS